MNKEFTPYSPSLDLKELGFNEPCLGWYRQNEVTIVGIGWVSEIELQTNFDENGEDNLHSDQCTAPTYRQAFAFLRKLNKLTIRIEDEVDKEYSWSYWISGVRYINHPYQPYFNTYEEAEIACLIKYIEIVKNK